MHKLETRYLFYGSKVNLGSFGVIGVKFWFSLKMHYLFYITKYIHFIHTLASHLRNKQGNWGQSGVDVLKPAGYAVCDGNMSSSFCICKLAVAFYMINEIQPKIKFQNIVQCPFNLSIKQVINNFPIFVFVCSFFVFVLTFGIFDVDWKIDQHSHFWAIMFFL